MASAKNKIKEQSEAELKQMCDDIRAELVKMSVRKGVGEAAENPLKVRTMRREIARILTEIRERENKRNG